MRHRPWTLLCLVVAGCSGTPAAPADPEPEAVAAPAAVPPPVVVPGTSETAVAPAEAGLDEESAAEAMRAYRAAIAAYNAQNPAGYFGSFLDPLTCFHGARAHPLDRLRASRGDAFLPDALRGLHIADLTALRAGPDEVVLVDRGAYWILDASHPGGARPYMTSSSDPIDQGVHEKIVVMRRTSGIWRIAAETDRRNVDCIEPAIVLDEMPASLASCRSASTTCLRGCDAICTECEGGCNGCNLCPEECLVALAECVGAPAGFTPYE